LFAVQGFGAQVEEFAPRLDQEFRAAEAPTQTFRVDCLEHNRERDGFEELKKVLLRPWNHRLRHRHSVSASKILHSALVAQRANQHRVPAREAECLLQRRCMLRNPDRPSIRGGEQNRRAAQLSSDIQQAGDGSIRRAVLDIQKKTAAAVAGTESELPIISVNAVDRHA
jgi:hypothetical protein